MTVEPETGRFIGGRIPTREDCWTKLLRNIGHWTLYGHGVFTVRERQNGAFVGEVGLAYFARGLGSDSDPYPEARWVLAKRRQGKGFAREAVESAHEWTISRTGATRTACIIHPENVPSLRLAEQMRYRPFGAAEYRGDKPVMFARTV